MSATTATDRRQVLARAALLINLGCNIYADRYPGWINVDLYDKPGVTLRADVRRLPLGDRCALLVFAGHLLEHFPSEDAPALLREWWRLVLPGGSLAIVVPDIAKGREWLADGRIDAAWFATMGLRGGPDIPPGEAHLAEYTAASLHATMAAALPDARLLPISVEDDPLLVSAIGWQSGWEAFRPLPEGGA